MTFFKNMIVQWDEKNGDKKMKIFLILIIFAPPLEAVDINTASAAELARELSGIGKIKAQRIVEYREKMGGFVSLEQLTEVRGIGPKTLERNRDKIDALTSYPNAKPQLEITPPSNRAINTNLSPKFKKPPRYSHNRLWDALIIIPLFVACLFIFVTAWLKNKRKDKQVQRKHLLTTTFVCSGCGKVSQFKNVRYEGHFANQYVDGDLPPGWVCLPNCLGKPCDYCFDCRARYALHSRPSRGVQGVPCTD